MHPDYATATWDDDHDSTTPAAPWPDVQKRYANDVRRIDDCVGDLLQLLKDLKIEDNTFVVFTSDNGPSIESYLKEAYRPTFFRGFGPLDGIKRDTLEGGVRVPTLVRWPHGIPAGSVDSQPSGQWDWLATFADLAGAPALAASDGVSLLPSLKGGGQRMPGTLYVEYFNNAKTPDFQDFAPTHRGKVREQMQAIYLDGYKAVRYNVKSRTTISASSTCATTRRKPTIWPATRISSDCKRPLKRACSRFGSPTPAPNGPTMKRWCPPWRVRRRANRE